MLSQTTRLFSEKFQIENVKASQYHDIQIQIEIEAEIKSHGESKTISTLDWKNPLYFKKPGTCELMGAEIANNSLIFSNRDQRIP